MENSYNENRARGLDRRSPLHPPIPSFSFQICFLLSFSVFSCYYLPVVIHPRILSPGSDKTYMSVDVKAETIIARPRADVADIMFDPKSEPIWLDGLKQVFPQSPGKLVKGSRLERRGTLAGLEYVSEVLVTNDDPGKMLEFSSPEPFEMKIRYNLEDSADGTSVRIRIQSIGDTSRISMPPSVLSNKVREGIESDLKKLKKHLENNV